MKNVPTFRFVLLLALLAVSGVAPQFANASSASAETHDGGFVPPVVEQLFRWIATGIEVVGIAIITVGALGATALFLNHLLRREAIARSYQQYRDNLGRAILLSLEFLVAADIVGTVAVEPTFENLGVLGVIVLIRTFLSVALGAEIHGHWPWKASELAIRSREVRAA